MGKKFVGRLAFLSNFANYGFVAGGVTWPTVEHFFQAMKTLDSKEREEIRCLKTPAEVRRVGKRVQLRKDWHEVRLSVMEYAVLKKFEQNATIAKWLFRCSDEDLTEENSWGDTFWGTCKGEGQNHLGLILRKVRDHLKIRQPISLKVVGVTYKNIDGTHRQRAIRRMRAKGGEVCNITAVRHLNNIYDDNAIAVMNGENVQIGWVAKASAARLAPHMDNGMTLKLEVKKFLGGGEYNWGLVLNGRLV